VWGKSKHSRDEAFIRPQFYKSKLLLTSKSEKAANKREYITKFGGRGTVINNQGERKEGKGGFRKV